MKPKNGLFITFGDIEQVECHILAVWVRSTLEELLLPQQLSTQLYIDNQSAMKLAKHLMTKPASRHILLRYHWLRK